MDSQTDDDFSALVTNVQGYSIHDGPGIRTVIFLKGCSLECRWCSNPEASRANRKSGYSEISVHLVEPVPKYVSTTPSHTPRDLPLISTAICALDVVPV